MYLPNYDGFLASERWQTLCQLTVFNLLTIMYFIFEVDWVLLFLQMTLLPLLSPSALLLQDLREKSAHTHAHKCIETNTEHPYTNAHTHSLSFTYARAHSENTQTCDSEAYPQIFCWTFTEKHSKINNTTLVKIHI